MARLILSFLGPFRVTLDGNPAAAFESNKVRALLAYLAVESDRPHARDSLAGLLWPDYPDRSALANLRSALANLRGAIGDRDAEPPYLLITRSDVQFNVASDHVLDTAVLQGAAARSIEELEAIADIYQGDFLDGFSLADSPPFEAWLLLRREQFGQQAREVHSRLAAHYASLADYDRAISHARRQLQFEAWDEVAHRQLMRCLALSGRRSLALAHYELCCRTLEDELGVLPAQETTALYEQIRDETLEPTALLVGTAPPPEPPAPGAPPFQGLSYFDEQDSERFFGREEVTAELAAQVQACLDGDDGRFRVVTVTGASGSGKSSTVRAGLVPALRRISHPGTGDCVRYHPHPDPHCLPAGVAGHRPDQPVPICYVNYIVDRRPGGRSPDAAPGRAPAGRRG